jgi:mutator protein MutT
MGDLIPVVVAIIPEEDERGIVRYLMTRRSECSKYNAREWEFSGGRKEPGESFEEALERELREELGEDFLVEVGDKFAESPPYLYEDGRNIRLIPFNCRHLSGDVQITESIMDYDWIRPENMHLYNISKPDLVLVEKLKQKAL